MLSSLTNLFRKKVRVEDQLSALALLGIGLRPGITVEDFLSQFDRSFYEGDPYRRLLPVMGENGRVGEGRFSDDILMIDTECIEGNGSYVRVLQPMAAMTRGALPFTDLQDSIENPEQAYVQFRLRGRTQRWNVTVDADWIDPTILGRMAALLAQQGTPLEYVYCNPGGQSALIACRTRAQMDKLNALTRFEFKPLYSPESS